MQVTVEDHIYKRTLRVGRGEEWQTNPEFAVSLIFVVVW